MKNIVFAFFTLAIFVSASCQKTVSDQCIDPAKINNEALCTMQYDPVCGCDGKTYGNQCQAEIAGVTSWKKGECGGSDQ